MTLLQLFYRFLKQNNIYHIYFKNLKNRKIKNGMFNDMNNTLAYRLISDAFDWNHTKEDYMFWENINYKWINTLIKYFEQHEINNLWSMKTNRKMKHLDGFINIIKNVQAS